MTLPPNDPHEELTVTFAQNPAGLPEHPEVWGQFRDLRHIGGGSFGRVYRAWDTQLHREVALKLLLPRSEADQSDAVQEARMMARVRHPNIVPVYGVAMVQGRVGFWSELIEGPTLAALVHDSGPLEPRVSAAIVADLCKAVGAMHTAGILHRDLKAENVLRDSSGRVLLTDFGLSRDPGGRFFGGTPAYMAPELMKGQAHTPASDVYALGMLMYFLTTGMFARDGQPAPALPRAWAEVVARALAPQPEARFATAHGMLVAIEACLSESGGSLPPRPQSLRRWVLLGAVPAACLAASVWWFLSRHAAPPSADTMYEKGQVLLLRRDRPDNVKAATGLFAKAVEADPGFALARARLADALWAQYRQSRDPGFKARAIAESDAAAALQPDSAEVLLVKGRIHAGTGQTTLAASDFERALKLDARNAEAYRELGQIYDVEGRDTDADGAFQKAIDLDPGNWWNYNARGNRNLKKGRLEEAAADFEKELQITPDNLWGLNNLATLRMDQEKFGEARHLLEQAIAYAPKDPTAYDNLGYLLMQQGRFDDAAARYDLVTRLTPSRYLAWGNLASAIEFGAGGIAKARPVYRKAIELAAAAHNENPADATLTAFLGDYLAAAGDRESALSSLRQAIAQAPENSTVLILVGEGYEILGLRDKAIPLVEDALRRGYPERLVKQSPDLAALLRDSRFRWPDPSAGH